MKKSLLALAVLALAGSAFAISNCGSGTSCSTPGSSSVSGYGSGSNSVTSKSSTVATVGPAGGSSYSYAANSQAASASISVTGNAFNSVMDCNVTLGGAVTTAGAVSTSGSSMAFNVSTGSGNGGAAAGGSSFATVTGAAKYSASTPTGNASASGSVGGSATAETTDGVIVTKNMGAQTGGKANAGFDQSASSSVTAKGTCSGSSCTLQSDTKVTDTSSTSYVGSSGITGVTAVTVDGVVLAKPLISLGFVNGTVANAKVVTDTATATANATLVDNKH